MWKKILIGVVVFILAFFTGLFLFLGAPYDPDKSPYFHMEPPDNIQRTQEHPYVGQRTTFLEMAHETDEEYTLLEVELEPGRGNSVHFHDRFSETFYPKSGTLGVHHDGKDMEVEVGDSVIVEPGEQHRFFNPSDDEAITFQVLIEPGSSGFEKALYILYGLGRDGKLDEDGAPESIYYTAIFMVLSDTRAPGIFSALTPLMSRIAGRAQRLGIEEELFENYYVNLTE